jgi:hypothetical protein
VYEFRIIDCLICKEILIAYCISHVFAALWIYEKQLPNNLFYIHVSAGGLRRLSCRL